MVDRFPRVSPVTAKRALAAIGGSFVVLSAGQAIRYVRTGEPVLDAVGALLLVGIPGVLVFYVGYRLPETNVTPDTYPRVLGWTLGGFGLLLVVVGFLVLSPGFSIDRASWSVVLATAIGAVAGTAVGFNEALAFSRAHDAEEALENLTVQVRERDADVAVDPLPRALGDAAQLRQVFQNLLGNAITYSDEAPEVSVSAERDGDEWVVSVRDEGVGIEPEDQERIFEVFQRLDGGEDHPGTGIGLALSERIVERHDGRIWVDSEPGEGSTFSFTLPGVQGRADE